MNNQQSDELRAIALKILNQSQVPKDNQHGFALITILMIISVVLTCIRILQECNKNKLSTLSTQQDKYGLYAEQIKYFSSHKGWFTKMRIKKILKKEMSREDYAKYSLSIMMALLDTGEMLTDEEIITLVEAANV